MLSNNVFSSKNVVTTVKPNAAIVANVASASAAPNPVNIPAQKPWAIDLLMHKTPIGPTTAAIEKPKIIPLIKV